MQLRLRLGALGLVCGFAAPTLAKSSDSFEASSANISKEDRAVAATAVTRVAHIETATGGVCAGSLVDTDLVLTAWHCLDDLRYVEVTFRGDPALYRGTVVSYDDENDLGVVKLDRRVKLKPLAIKKNDDVIADGTPLIVIGHPNDARYTVTAGKAIEPSHSFFLLNAKVDHGNSGGPILNHDGEIIGVVIILNKFMGGRELGEAVASFPIHNVMERAKARREVSWRAAEGSGYFDFAYGRDDLLDEVTDLNYGTFVYAIGWDYYDRWRLGFRHFTMRHERVWGYETGPVFKNLWGEPALLFGRNYYFPDGPNFITNKFGIGFELFFLDVTYFRMQHDGKSYSAFTIGF